MFNTVEEIVDDLIASSQDDESIGVFIDTPEDRLAMFHHSLGTHIRNEYHLWNTSPLTKHWRECEDERTTIDGIDHSEDHPDAVSMKIIIELHKKLKAMQQT